MDVICEGIKDNFILSVWDSWLVNFAMIKTSLKINGAIMGFQLFRELAIEMGKIFILTQMII